MNLRQLFADIPPATHCITCGTKGPWPAHTLHKCPSCRPTVTFLCTRCGAEGPWTAEEDLTCRRCTGYATNFIC